MIRARVRIVPRDGVLDPQGRAVAAALVGEGFPEVRDAVVGRDIELRLALDDVGAARARVAAMCEALLANPVLERYEIDVGPA